MNLSDLRRERAVLVAVMRLEGFAADMPTHGGAPECFTDKVIRDIVLAALTLAEAGKPIREIDVLDELTRLRRCSDRHKEAVAWAGRETDPKRDGALVDLARVVKLWQARNYLAAIDETRQAFDPGDVDASLVEAHTRMTDALALVHQAAKPKSWRRSVQEFVFRITQPENRKRESKVLPTHIFALDRLLGGGLQPGVYTIIAARPSQGKSAILKSIVHKIARSRTPPKDEHGRPRPGGPPPVPFKIFSPEMSTDQFIERLLEEEARMTRDKLLYDHLTEADIEDLFRATEWANNLPIEVDDRSTLSIADVIAGIREWARAMWPGCNKENPPPPGTFGFVGIDYLQKLKGPPGLPRNASPRDINTAISRGLATVIREFPWIVFVALAQLSRGPAKEDRDPTMEDLKEAGAYEEDADTILMIKRHGDAYKDANGTSGIDGRLMSIFARKNRNGSPGACDLLFLEKYTAFFDWPHDYPSPRALRAMYAGEADERGQPVEPQRGRRRAGPGDRRASPD